MLTISWVCIISLDCIACILLMYFVGNKVTTTTANAFDTTKSRVLKGANISYLVGGALGVVLILSGR